MSRLLSHFAAFVIAGATAYASLADASAPRPVRAPAVELVTATADVPQIPVLDGGDPLDWATRIELRLDALAAVRAAGTDQNSPDFGPLPDRLDRVTNTAASDTRVAVHVRDLQSGQTVFDHGGDRSLNPASNQKILTSMAAVELLGADYQFETRLVRDADTLYLIGEGDPGLRVDHLYALAHQAVASGEAEGIRRIVVDESAFSERRFGPGYDADGPGVAYMAPSGALSLTFNTIEITVSPAEYGAPVRVHVQPHSAHVVVESEATTGVGSGLYADTEPVGDTTVVRLSGRLRAGHAPVKLRRRVYDPALFTGGSFAIVLADLLSAEPLRVERGTAPPDAAVVATHRSLPLSRSLDAALKYSNNFCTEQVLRTLGWRASGRPGSWTNGTAAVEDFWATLGHDGDELAFVNGSGLSRSGRATPRALVDLLALTHREGSDSASLLSSMAGAGGEGTLRLRMAQARGRVRAKTGTLNGVSALSGVVASEDGSRTLGFSILVNGGDATRSRALQDRMVLSMLAAVDHG